MSHHRQLKHNTFYMYINDALVYYYYNSPFFKLDFFSRDYSRLGPVPREPLRTVG